jgi:hypothetical protein
MKPTYKSQRCAIHILLGEPIRCTCEIEVTDGEKARAERTQEIVEIVEEYQSRWSKKLEQNEADVVSAYISSALYELLEKIKSN